MQSGHFVVTYSAYATLRIRKSPGTAKTVQEGIALWVHMQTEPLTRKSVGILRKEESCWHQYSLPSKVHPAKVSHNWRPLLYLLFMASHGLAKQLRACFLVRSNSSQSNFTLVTNLYTWQSCRKSVFLVQIPNIYTLKIKLIKTTVNMSIKFHSTF
jgi:hypothetical protein